MDDASWRARLYAGYGRAPTIEKAADDHELRRPELHRLVRRHFPPDRSAVIADLGCGSGALLGVAREAGYGNIMGWDRAPSQVALAAALGIEGVREGDLMEVAARIADGSLDAVIAFDVIEHLTREETLRLADDVRRVLRPGGRWIVHVPNGNSPFVGRVLHSDLTHERAYTRESLAQLAHATGFSAVSSHEDAPAAHGAISAMRWLGWQVVRTAIRLCIAVESGDSGRGAVFSQNMIAVFVK